jgi:hypothetical protein
MGMSDGVPGAFSDGVDYHRVVLPTRGGVTAGWSVSWCGCA